MRAGGIRCPRMLAVRTGVGWESCHPPWLGDLVRQRAGQMFENCSHGFFN